MPSKKKKSKAKGRKAAAGKGDANKAADNVQKQGTLHSEMQRLKIGEQQAGDGGDDALLEEAIKLAAVEEQEMKVKEKENCTHGYNPSMFQKEFSEDYFKIYFEEFYASTRRGDFGLHNKLDRLTDGFRAARAKYAKELNRDANLESIKSYSLAEGTKFILDGNCDDARLCAALAFYMKVLLTDFTACNAEKLLELSYADEHTLVKFFKKQIPCTCLDEKYKEVKISPKMGICSNRQCPLPGRSEVRSSMLCCTGCRKVNYCSRECQEVDWPHHKNVCNGKYHEDMMRQFVDVTAQFMSSTQNN